MPPFQELLTFERNSWRMGGNARQAGSQPARPESGLLACGGVGGRPEKPDKVMDAALNLAGVKNGSAAAPTKAALLRNLDIAEKLGCLDAEGLGEQRLWADQRAHRPVQHRGRGGRDSA